MHEIEISQYLDDIKSNGLFRSLQNNQGLDFSSNDYLGLSRNESSIRAGIIAAQKYGSGSTGSRLLTGNKLIFTEFEEKIARDKKFETSLIYNSGYIANLSIISAFSSIGYLLIFDKANHASMYHGAQLGKLERFRHLDYSNLEEILDKHKNNHKKIIVSETVFSMDGDIADVSVLTKLATKYNAILFIDEAHATGLYGHNGYGISTNFDLDKRNTIVMGTFSKALASQGAYVASSSIFKDYFIQASKGLVYSTALAPFSIGVAMHNWDNLCNMEDIRKSIFDKSSYLRTKLQKLGFECIGANTNIIAINFDSIVNMFDIHNKLLKNGIVTSAVRRPTSPTPRIRISINANHSYDDIDLLLSALT